MSAQGYSPARAQIAQILAGRTQARRILNAREVSDLLTCWPVPPLRTIRRYMEQVRIKAEASAKQQSSSGHGGQSAAPAARVA
jgi:hypothetical protein